MKNFFLILNQPIIGIVVYILLLFKKIKIDQSEFKHEKGRKYILIANHTSKKDPFIITPFLPLNVKFRLLPYHYLTTENYLKNTPMRLFLYWCGCFSTSSEMNKGIKPLNLAQKFIDRGETIFIFPEGKINKRNKYDSSIDVGIGTLYLAKNNPEHYILPVRIEYKNSKIIKIKYGKPFRPKSFPKDLKPLMRKIMTRIYE